MSSGCADVKVFNKENSGVLLIAEVRSIRIHISITSV